MLVALQALLYNRPAGVLTLLKYIGLHSNLTSGANGIGAEYAKAVASAGYVRLFYLFAVFVHHYRG
jgi:hypothetical protein